MQHLDNKIVLQDTLIATIDGNENKTLKQFYHTIAEALSFPDYFSYNLDSFDEMIADLSWIEQQEIAVIIYNKVNFLSEEEEEIKNILVDIINQAEENNMFLHFFVR